MPRARSLANELKKLLAATSSPVYAVDDRWRLIYVNPTCATWLGVEAASLLGQTCTYQSADISDPAERLAAALCPPPEAMTGKRVTATITCAIEGEPRSRQCEFIPLYDAAAGAIGVLAIVAAADTAPVDVSPADDEVTDWHAVLQRHRAEFVARFQPNQLLGVSPAMRRMRRQVELASRGRASVLVVGPPGIGRRHVARSIHYARSGESSGTLVPLSCAMLDRDSLRSAWAAVRSTQAREPARIAALLLEEVDQLPADAQSDLARWLKDESESPRVLATSRRALLELADEGAFAMDAAYALSTMVVSIPPLAERPEDIPLLAQAAVEDINAEGQKQLGGCTPEALDRLAAYDWPDNLHELSAVLRDAHQRARGTAITQRDLPDQVRLADELWRDRNAADEPIVLDDFLVEIERRLLERALTRAGGNKTKAAQLLGVSRPRLYRRLVQFGLAQEGEEEES